MHMISRSSKIVCRRWKQYREIVRYRTTLSLSHHKCIKYHSFHSLHIGEVEEIMMSLFVFAIYLFTFPGGKDMYCWSVEHKRIDKLNYYFYCTINYCRYHPTYSSALIIFIVGLLLYWFWCGEFSKFQR